MVGAGRVKLPKVESKSTGLSLAYTPSNFSSYSMTIRTNKFTLIYFQ